MNKDRQVKIKAYTGEGRHRPDHRSHKPSPQNREKNLKSYVKGKRELTGDQTFQNKRPDDKVDKKRSEPNKRRRSPDPNSKRSSKGVKHLKKQDKPTDQGSQKSAPKRK
jgi:hypothetical protein